MKLVTVGDGAGRVGYVDGEEVAILDVPTRARISSAAAPARRGSGPAGGRPAAGADRAEEVLPHRRQLPRAPGGVEGRRLVAPDRAVDRLLPERRRDRRPRRAIVYPERLTKELDYELELAVVMARPASGSRPRRRRTTSPATWSSTTSPPATSSAARCAPACSRFCKAIDTFCPLGPWIVTPDEIPDPHDLAMELRVNGEDRQVSHSAPDERHDPRDPLPLLGARLLGRATCSRPGRCPAWPASPRTPRRST